MPAHRTRRGRRRAPRPARRPSCWPRRTRRPVPASPTRSVPGSPTGCARCSSPAGWPASSAGCWCCGWCGPRRPRSRTPGRSSTQSPLPLADLGQHTAQMSSAPMPDDWQRALVVAAHPDDIEYGMAAAVAVWTAKGKEVHYLLATRGEAGMAGVPPTEAGPLREEEERRSAAVVGGSEVEFLDHRDGTLVAGPELRRDLAAAIRRHRPELVVTGYFGATWTPPGVSPAYVNSADHRALGQCVLDAVADAANEWIFPELTEERWSGVQYIAVGELA